MTIYLSAAVAVVGLILYLISVSPKPAETGRIMFACGLLVFLALFAGKVLHG